jgi:hypothetical protein
MDLLGKFNNMQAPKPGLLDASKQHITQKRTSENKEAQRHEPLPSQEQDKKVKEEKERDSYTRGARSETPKTHQKKTNQVLKHFISQTDAKKKIDKQDKTNKKAATQDAQEPEQQQAKVPLDNASRIGLMYQQQMRKQQKKGQQESRVGKDGPPPQQQQMKRFLANVREFVKTEYKQYTRPEISPYSRRNLREILSALGEEVKAFDNKIGKDRRDRQKGVEDNKSFNRHYAATASKNLKLFADDPMMDLNYEPVEMTA